MVHLLSSLIFTHLKEFGKFDCEIFVLRQALLLSVREFGSLSWLRVGFAGLSTGEPVGASCSVSFLLRALLIL